MFKFALFVIFFTMLLTSIVNSVSDSEYIVLNFVNYVIEINSLFATFLLIIFIALIALAVRLIYNIIDLPKNNRLRLLAKNNQNILENTTNAITAIQLGNFAKAKTEINKLRKIQDNKVLPYILEAQAALVTQDDKLLGQIFEKILEIDKKNSFAQNGLGALAFKNRDYSQSQKYLESAYDNNEKAKNILPALIKTYFINNESEKLEILLESALKSKAILKNDYITEFALNAYLLAEDFYSNNEFIKADKYISKAYKLYPQYFPIFKLYIENLVQRNKSQKARNLVLKNWHLYNESKLISLYEISSKNLKSKRQLLEIQKLQKELKSDLFLPIIYGKIALSTDSEELYKKAESFLENNQQSLEYKIGLETLYKLKEKLYGEHNITTTNIKTRLLKQTTNLGYRCENCDHTTKTQEHICSNCTELASPKETLLNQSNKYLEK